MQRKLFYKLISRIVESEAPSTKVIHNFQVGEFVLPLVLIEKNEHWKELGGDNVLLSFITIIDFPNAFEIKELKQIIFLLQKEYNCVDIFRVPYDKWANFLIHAIPYFTHVNSPFSSDQLARNYRFYNF